MREVKFRVWDGKKMYAPWKLDWLIEGKGTPGHWLHYDNSLDLWPSDTEFLQYTGLKDKNGVEVYEGDIVRHVHHQVGVDYENGMTVVEWRDNGFKGTSIDHTYIGAWLPNKDSAPNGEGITSFEVIGNIYENPELLHEAGDA